MAQRTVESRIIKGWIKDAGFSSQSKFAHEVGLDGPKLTKSLAGDRRVQMDEVSKMAARLNQTPANVAAAFGVQYADPLFDSVMKIVASVGDGDVVFIYDENADDFGMEEVDIPFVAYSGAAICIKTDRLAPRYFSGEVIGVKLWDEDPNVPEPQDIEAMIGRDVIANVGCTSVLKTLQRGSQQGHWTLISLDPRQPPIVNIAPTRLRLVDFHLPVRLKLR